MEKEENKLRYEDISELMEKITLSMKMTREKQNSIDTMVEEIYDQPLSMKVEDQKKEIEMKKEEKAEFDEMTKNALINAKKLILQVREASEKEYQEKLLETSKKQNNINKKLISIKKRLTDEEELDKISIAEEKANSALEKVSNEMKEFQEKHFELRKDLELQEKNVLDFAIELGVEKQIDNVTLKQIEPNEDKIEEVVTTKNESEPSKVEKVNPTTTKKKEISTKWYPNLTEAQIDYIKSELDIYEPVGQEYEQALKQLGFNKSNQPKKNNDKQPEWHPDLTEEQIDYMKSELDIYEPVGQEYEQALKQLGIKAEKKLDNVEKKVDNVEKKEEKKSPDKNIKETTEEELKRAKMKKLRDLLEKKAKEQENEPAKAITESQEKEQAKGVTQNQTKEPISILFNTNSRSYILNREEEQIKGKFGAVDHITIKLDDIIYDKKFKEFNESFVEQYGEILGLDPYIAYIISESDIDKEHSDKILEEYVDAMKGDKQVGEEGLDLLKISYDMSGIYGRQYPSKVSDQLMSYANAHNNINCATVNKDRMTTFLEKHKILRKIHKAITNRGKIEDRLLPEPRSARKNESEGQQVIDSKQDEKKERINIPMYSQDTMYVLQASSYKDMKERFFSIEKNKLTTDENKAIADRMMSLYEKEKRDSGLEQKGRKEGQQTRE